MIHTRRLRWYIGGLLFLSTVVNYMDRQTLSVLAPILKEEYRWTNTDYAMIIIAFRVAYSFGQLGWGPFLDRVGTRTGLSLTVALYSAVAVLTSLATGLRSFAGFRFMLGLGEAANWPGATKAVSEWFPRRESGWAVALFDSGSSIGAAVGPFLVLWLYHTFGTWRPVFVIVGSLGFLWLLLFRWMYHSPETHPWISPEERAEILADREADQPAAAETRPLITYSGLLKLPQTWGIVIGKALTDPVWFLITDWFAILLRSRGFTLEETVMAFWVPFLAADAGNFIGGGVSSALIKRGMPVGTARKWVVTVGGLGMSGLALSVWITDLFTLTAVFAVATCAYAAASTVILNLPADVYWTRSVATVSGMGGAAAGVVTIGATFLTGVVTDRYSSFEPVLIAASIVPLFAVVAVLALVRNNGATTKGLVRAI